MFKTNIDVARNSSIREFLAMITGATVVDFTSMGPGGANPNVTLSFRTKEDAKQFLIGWYPEDSVAWIESQIDELVEPVGAPA